MRVPILLVVLIFSMFIAMTISGQQSRPKDREGKIAAALKFFGDVDDFGGNATDLATALGVIGMQKEAVAKEKAVSEVLPSLARNVATKYKNVLITVKTTEHASLEKVQSVLGKEDSIEDDKEASVTWYKYDWCHFGVKDKQVTLLRANCDAAKQ